MRTTLTWLGQGGFLLECGEFRMAVDPYLSNYLLSFKNGDPGFGRMLPPPIAPEELHADVLVATHDHCDHLDPQTVRPMADAVQTFLGPDSCAAAFQSLGVAPQRILAFNRSDRLRVGDVCLEAAYACHTQDSIGLYVYVPQGMVYFTGDSLLDERMLAQQARPDILVCCINGKLGNMDAVQAAELACALRVKVAIPCHYGLIPANTEDPGKFCAALPPVGPRCLPLAMGIPYTWAQLMGEETNA